MEYLSMLRNSIEMQYQEHPTHCGNSFGEILCYELHTAGLTFIELAEKWGISLAQLGELIWDHCKRLDKVPFVDHMYDQREGFRS